TADALVRLGAELRQHTIEHDTEFGAVLDLRTSAALGPVQPGGRDGVSLGALLRTMQPGREYVALHTHPFSASFSLGDLAMLLFHRPLRTTAVVAADGHWYALSKMRGQPTPLVQEGEIAWVRTLLRLNPEFDRLVAVGQLTPEQANREIWHAIMQ